MNYGNHLGNDALLSILHDARMQFLSSHGFTELSIGDAGLIMADVMIAYKGEGYFGDVLTIELYPDEVSARSFDLLYRVTAARKGNTVLIAEAKTGMVCFDYKTRKITEMPTVLQQVLQPA